MPQTQHETVDTAAQSLPQLRLRKSHSHTASHSTVIHSTCLCHDYSRSGEKEKITHLVVIASINLVIPNLKSADVYSVDFTGSRLPFCLRSSHRRPVPRARCVATPLFNEFNSVHFQQASRRGTCPREARSNTLGQTLGYSWHDLGMVCQ